MSTLEERKKYTLAPWRKLRAYKLSLNPFCERCKLQTIAKEVHHIKDAKTYPELFYELTNLESLCKPCHSSHTAKENKPKPGKILNKIWQ